MGLLGAHAALGGKSAAVLGARVLLFRGLTIDDQLRAAFYSKLGEVRLWTENPIPEIVGISPTRRSPQRRTPIRVDADPECRSQAAIRQVSETTAPFAPA